MSGQLNTAKALPTFRADLRQMVRSGHKTMTRRLLAKQPPRVDPEPPLFPTPGYTWPPQPSPKFEAGEVLYLREPLVRKWVKPGKEPMFIDDIKVKRGAFAFYKDDGKMVLVSGKPLLWRWKRKVLPSVFMPRKAARVFVKVQECREEWLQECSAGHAKREGVQTCWSDDNSKTPGRELYFTSADSETKGHASPVTAFALLWDSINVKRGHGWEKNERVRVLGWELIA